MAVGDAYGVLGRSRALLQVAGEAMPAVAQRAERGLDAPAQRQRLEALHVRVAGRDLDVHAVVLGCLCHARADVDAINLDTLNGPAALDRKRQQRSHRLRVMHVGRRHQDGQHKAQRARQHVALDAAHPFVAVHAARAGLRTRGHALAVKEGGCRLRRPALPGAHRSREKASDVGPDAVGPEAVVPGAHDLPGAELLWEKAPRTARLFQIQAGVDHLAQVRRQCGIAAQDRLNRLPFRVRQIARLAPAIVLVSFPRCASPHRSPPCGRTTRNWPIRSNRLSVCTCCARIRASRSSLERALRILLFTGGDEPSQPSPCQAGHPCRQWSGSQDG